MLVIDKKRLPLKDSGLPQIVIDQTPKRARRAKVPVIKAKIGPKVTSLIADENVYDLIPVKAEIKAMISGIYITSINNFRKAPKAHLLYLFFFSFCLLGQNQITDGVAKSS